MQAELKEAFSTLDVNKDGVLTVEDLQKAFASIGAPRPSCDALP